MVDKINGSQPQPLHKPSAQEYDDWTDGIIAAPLFQITNTKGNYFDDLEYLAKGYIALHDLNKDGQISYEEFLNKEIKRFEEQGHKISKKEADKYLKPVFQYLNVNNNGNNDVSKEQLSLGEVMNMFLTMDASNFVDEKAKDKTFKGEIDFVISAQECKNMNDEMTSYNPNSSKDSVIHKKLKDNYNTIFEGLDNF